MEAVLVFANSIAGRGRGKVIASRLSEALTHAGCNVRVFLDPPDKIVLSDIRDVGLARAAVIIGGDGTLRTVTERLIQAFDMDSMPPLLVVPLGTANLMARHLGIDWHGTREVSSVVAAIDRRKIVFLDAARANGQLFLLMAGVGMDGHVIHELDRVRVGPIDLASYVLPVAMAMQKYTYPAIRVEVDGIHVFGPAPGMAFIANAPEYGTGFPILPQARSDDGLLDICALPCKSRAEMLNLLMSAAAGEHLEVEGAQTLQGRRIRVEADEPIPVQLDGEAGGFTPLEIELLPTKVGFIVP